MAVPKLGKKTSSNFMEQSKNQKAYVIQTLVSWGPALLWAGLLYLQSAQSSVPSVEWLPFGDKVGHSLLYAIFGLALGWGSRNVQHKGLRIGIVLTGVLFAASDEWHQAFVPRREPSLGDFGADLAGILVGFLVVSYLFKRRKRHNPGAFDAPLTLEL